MEIGYERASLNLAIHERRDRETLFVARVRDAQFSGEVIVSDFFVGDPSSLFVAMANNWRGWEGTLEWAEHEGRLTLEATSNGRGHVTLMVAMRRYEPEARLLATIEIDAGQLEQIARDAQALFGTGQI